MDIHRIYRPFLSHFRRKRMRQLCQILSITKETRVVDVGGDPSIWSLAPVRPTLVIVNVRAPKSVLSHDPWVIADGRHLPFKDKTFDVAFSNSTIEHVGDYCRQIEFAKEVTRVGKVFVVQTPNRWFPVEPHLMTPLIHFLPRSLQRRLLRWFTVWGWVARPDKAACDHFMNEVRLLSSEEMARIFPGARITHERFLGLRKSLIAVGNHEP
jgi:SAM-dependent methyltransferase